MQSQKSYVSIPGLQYGQGGDFAISIWTKMHLVTGMAGKKEGNAWRLICAVSMLGGRRGKSVSMPWC